MFRRKFTCIVFGLLIAAGSVLELTAAPALPPQKSGKDLEALEKKLLGPWEGQGGCVGDITFQSAGTFGRRHYGPGNASLTGSWEIRWDALPPTLILKCTASDHDNFLGKTVEVKIVQLDESTLSLLYPGEKMPTRYERPKE